MRHLIYFSVMFAVLGIFSAPPPPPPPFSPNIRLAPVVSAVGQPPQTGQSMKISNLNLTQIEDKTVESYFRLDYSDDNVAWKPVGFYSQNGVTNSQVTEIRIKIETGNPLGTVRRWPVSKVEFDNAPPSDGTFAVGIIVFKR